jgi:hypothetical protein
MDDGRAPDRARYEHDSGLVVSYLPRQVRAGDSPGWRSLSAWGWTTPINGQRSYRTQDPGACFSEQEIVSDPTNG